MNGIYLVATVKELRRTQIGDFHVDDALTLDKVTPEMFTEEA